MVVICGERSASTWMLSETFEVADLKPGSTGERLALRSSQKLFSCSEVDVKSFERLIGVMGLRGVGRSRT